MGYTITTTGMDRLISNLKKAGDAGQGIAAASLFEGAGIMADSVSQAVHGIATEPFHYVKNGRRKPSPEEKALLESAPKGVAKFHKNGLSVDTSVGMDNSGYGQIGDRTVPIPMIANAINSGTSFMTKQAFFRKATSQASGKALAAIDSSIENRVNNLLNNL